MRSYKTVVVGVELSVENSQFHRQKGTTNTRRLRKNESDSFCVDAYLNKAELQGHSSWLRAACSGGTQGRRS
jgi:hypothetical protein